MKKIYDKNFFGNLHFRMAITFVNGEKSIKMETSLATYRKKYHEEQSISWIVVLQYNAN